MLRLQPSFAQNDSFYLLKPGQASGSGSEHARLLEKRKSFQAALQSGVTIVMGGDVGVFAHGNNAWEMEPMVSYGMKPVDVLRSATSVNTAVFNLPYLGSVRKGWRADLVAVQGDPFT